MDVSSTILANGATIPVIGFGTWQLTGDVARQAVASALAVGYRHIDTAQIYRNEAEVGQGVKESGVPRDEVFLTTKVWTDRFRDGDLQRSAEESLGRLGFDYVDLLLLHWPNPAVPLAETIGALVAVRERGLARHVGVSNFDVEQLRQAVDLSAAPIVTNQVEFHPFLDQSDLLREAAALGAALTAYSPIAKGRAVDDPTIRRVAAARGRTPSQVALRWLLQQGAIVIPRSSNTARIEENFRLLDFALDEEEMTEISALAGRRGAGG